MASQDRGLHEALITEALEARLRELPGRLEPRRSELRAAEAPDRLALHLGRLIQRALAGVEERQRVATGIELARRLIDEIDALVTAGELAADRPVQPGEVLRALLERRPDGRPAEITQPLIPLLDTTLLTNAPGEPRVGSQLLAEIDSADRIDVVMAFIRRSGIRPLLAALRAHTEQGRSLRVLTTIYTNSTEPRALDELAEAGAQVRVSYDTATTRLHAKAWLFHRRSGFSTAYIGSSNLTRSAQVDGLEWNVRVSGARNPDVVTKIGAVLESYWNDAGFEPYDAAVFRERAQAAAPAGPTLLQSPIELRPEPFQERLLEQLELSRERGHHRNLLVSATGTGKTVMAAVDYARLREELPRARLLFVAHRKEILEQSLATFRHALRDMAFGELMVGGQRPQRFEHVFASIQSLDSTGLRDLAPDHFDVVTVDEFHHAASASYQRLLEHVRPIELLGLTATPERSDGLSVLEWFGGRIAAELRLWDAVDQHRLTPFLYYGIHDGLDLREVPWRRGRGYDVEGLTRVLTSSDVAARCVVDELERKTEGPHRVRALGFCVSVAHARFMARSFSEAGVPAAAIWADSPPDERRAALADLAARRVNVVFSVDLFNEGVDVPAVDTLLLLRPTDSPVLFLQQLGRGLRHSHGKSACTVLDFVGQHRQEFRFDRRLRALLGGSRQDLVRQIQGGFPFLPAGCHMELDPVARDIVLANIRRSVPGNWTAKVEELRSLARAGTRPRLWRYLEEVGLELEDVYGVDRSWSDLCAEAGAPLLEAGPRERTLRRGCGRLLHVDDPLRIEAYRRFVALAAPPDPARLDERERRLLRMLVAAVADRALTKSVPLDEGCRLLWAHPQVRVELDELLEALEHRIEHVQHPLETHPEVPLRIHARYSRIEILAALGAGQSAAKVAPWQTGVRWVESARSDLLAFTLDKTSGAFSPTTRYRDHAISRELIHWESQSLTRADSETGLRYQQHAARGSSVLLFARLRSEERAFWFLGPATYVSHVGEQPMAITWRLHRPLPGDLFASFAAAVA